MGDARKIHSLKRDLLEHLKREANSECSELHLNYIKCLRKLDLFLCSKQGKLFFSCWTKRFEELKAENKDVLDFEI